MAYVLREWYSTTASNRPLSVTPPSIHCRTSFQECVEIAAHEAHNHDVYIWKWVRSARKWKCVMFMTRKVARFLTD